jgi:hypothetical protein
MSRIDVSVETESRFVVAEEWAQWIKNDGQRVWMDFP